MIQKIITICVALTISMNAHAVDCAKIYSPSCFGGWKDYNQNCLDTREEVLLKTSTDYEMTSIKNCKVINGMWFDFYAGDYISDQSALDIDHIVPKKEAWLSGANQWTQEQRERFANDTENLIPTLRSINRSKGSKDIALWIPPSDNYMCIYLEKWTYIKNKYKLQIDKKEQEKINEMNKFCVYS
jgi:hypothetical protein